MATKRKPKKAAKKKKATAADLLREARAGSSEETFGFFSDTMFAEVKERISTGVLAIDKLTGGGWPIGAVTEVAAWEGVGKSTLLDQSLARNQQLGGMSALIDSEGARDSVYMTTLGVDLTNLIRIQSDTIEACFEAIGGVLDGQEALAKANYELQPLVIVWDSIGGTPSMAELEGDADSKHMMVAARNIKMNLRRTHNRLLPLRAALVCANHFYIKPGPIPQRVTYGGTGMQYFTAYRLWLTRKGAVKVGIEEYGHQVEGMLKKNRFGQLVPPTTMGVLRGRGFDNSFTLFEWCRENGAAEGHHFIDQRGAWYTFTSLPNDPDSVKFQGGFLGFHQLVAVDRPELYGMLAARYLQA